MSSRHTKPQWDPYSRSTDEHRLSEEDQERRKQMMRAPMVRRVGTSSSSSSTRSNSKLRSSNPSEKSIGVPNINEDGDFTYQDMQQQEKLKAELGHKATVRNNYLASRGIFFTEAPEESVVERDEEPDEQDASSDNVYFAEDSLYVASDDIKAHITPLKRWVENDEELRPQQVQSDGKKITMTPLPDNHVFLSTPGRPTASPFGKSTKKAGVQSGETSSNQGSNSMLDFIMKRQEELFERLDKLESQQTSSVSRLEVMEIIERAVGVKLASQTNVVKETATGVQELETLPRDLELVRKEHQSELRGLRTQVEDQSTQFQSQVRSIEMLQQQMSQYKNGSEQKRGNAQNHASSSSLDAVKSVIASGKSTGQSSTAVKVGAKQPLQQKKRTMNTQQPSTKEASLLLPNAPSFDSMDRQREAEDQALTLALEQYASQLPSKTTAVKKTAGSVPTFAPLASAPTPRDPLYAHQRGAGQQQLPVEPAYVSDGELRRFPVKMLSLPMRKDVVMEHH